MGIGIISATFQIAVLLFASSSDCSQEFQIDGKSYHLFFEASEKKNWHLAKQHCENMGLSLFQDTHPVIRMQISEELYATNIPIEEDIWTGLEYVYNPTHGVVYTRSVYGSQTEIRSEAEGYRTYHAGKGYQLAFICSDPQGIATFIKYRKLKGIKSPLTSIAAFSGVTSEKVCQLYAARYNGFSIDYHRIDHTCRIYNKRLATSSLLPATPDDFHYIRI